MSAALLNGRDIAQAKMKEVLHAVEKLGEPLILGTVQVGESKDSTLYAKSLESLLGKLKISILSRKFDAKISEKDLYREILDLQEQDNLTGVLLFAPFPAHIQTHSILNAVDPIKDAEGRTFLKSHYGISSPTASAVMALIKESKVEMAGKEAVVVGHSDVVGKPAAILLMDELATVTVCHIKTKDLQEKVKKADIVVAAAGKAHLIKGEWIKPGAVVIDVGENVLNGKLVGDVEFEEAAKRAAFISPVPGGVGPVTNVMLAVNLLKLHKLQKTLKASNGTR